MDDDPPSFKAGKKPTVAKAVADWERSHGGGGTGALPSAPSLPGVRRGSLGGRRGSAGGLGRRGSLNQRQKAMFDEWDFVHPAALKLEGDAILAGLATDPEDVEAMEEAARRRARLCACWPG